MKTPKEILRSEFDAENGSFLLQLRCDLKWDKVAFRRLIQSMFAVAKASEGNEPLERWIANGFWYIDGFVRDWSTHLNFPREFPDAYYQAAYELLHDLAYYLFMGQSPYENDGLEKKLNSLG